MSMPLSSLNNQASRCTSSGMISREVGPWSVSGAPLTLSTTLAEVDGSIVYVKGGDSLLSLMVISSAGVVRQDSRGARRGLDDVNTRRLVSVRRPWHETPGENGQADHAEDGEGQDVADQTGLPVPAEPQGGRVAHGGALLDDVKTTPRILGESRG